MYAMYLRKSRSDSPDEGVEETLHKHEKILFDLVDKMKINRKEIMVFREVVSGENIQNRPEVQKLLDYVMQGVFDGVFVVDSQRLARGDTLDQGTIIRAFSLNNTKIITPMKVIDPKNEYDQEYFEFDLFMGRREYKMITRRMQRGRHIAVQEGYYVGSVAPYGYNKVKIDKGYSLEINEEEFCIFKLMKQLALTGNGPTNISNILNDKGYKTRNNKMWTKSAVENILLNKTNLGLVKWNSRKHVKIYKDGKIVNTRPRNKEAEYYLGKHPAIITQEEYDTILLLMKQRSHKPTAKKKFSNPLAGVVTCKVCGAKMVRRPYPNRKDSIICPTSKCKNVASDLDILEKRIISLLEKNLIDIKKYIKDYSIDNQEFVNDKQVQLNALEKELETLQGQITKACEMLEIGAYTVDLFKERKTVLEKQINAVETKKGILQKETVANKVEQYKKAIPKIEKTLELYWDADVEEKNSILKSLIESCSYKKEKGGRWDSKAINNFKIDIILKH